MLNDLADLGQIDASLQLFNMYQLGADNLGVDRDMHQAQRYYNQIEHYINENGLVNLDASQVYNLGYAEMYNETRDENGVMLYGSSNLSKALKYFEYAAENGEVNALNALAILYMNGYNDPLMNHVLIKQNSSQAIALMEKAASKGNLDAAANLGRIFAIGMQDQ